MKLSRYEDLAKQIETLLGNLFNVKYYKNTCVEWAKILTDNENTYGSLKVIGGENQSVKNIKSVVDNFAVTFMCKEEEYADVSEHIKNVFSSLDKQLLLLGEDYSQFIYDYQSDDGQVVYNAHKYSQVSFYFNLITFVDLFLGDSQKIEIKVNNNYTELLGVTGIVYSLQCQYDGAVNGTAIQKNRIAAINQSLTIDGLVVKNDLARANIKAHLTDKTSFDLKYFDGETTFTLTARLTTYTCVGVSGNLVKYQIVFIQKG